MFSIVFSAHIGEDISLSIAQNAFEKLHPSKNRDNFIIKDIKTIDHENIPLFYIYNLEPKGFIIVSAENNALPILGYGFESNFKLDNMPSNLTYLLDVYKTELISLRSSEEATPLSIQEEWDLYLSSDTDNSNTTRDVSPLLDAEFDQSGAWNNALTVFGFYGPVGCVAVSMSQIMYYWEYPNQGVGSNYYNENDYGILEVDFSTAFYDYDNMAATYATSESQELLYHTGISVNMDYDNSGSGASVVGVYPSAEYALENFFLYNENISPIYKDNFSTTEFRNLLKAELENNKPILYSGYSNSNYDGGHAWNIDGYQGSNLHCNWGWGGWNNGYFNLSSMGGFPSYQTALMGVIPQIYMNPLALFEVEISEMTAIFIDLSEVVNETEIESWTWNFGDGNSETNTYAFNEYTYTNPGEYEVSLIVTNIYGETGEPHIEYIIIGNPTQPGDVNFDEVLNILDVVLIINFILGSDIPDDIQSNAADYNNDGSVNIQDIVLLLNTILD